MKTSPMFDIAALFLAMFLMMPLTQGERLSSLRKLQTDTTMTFEECRSRGPGWVPSSMVKCDDAQIGTKMEDNGCARCLCNQDNPPVQGQSCKPRDYCRTYGKTECGTEEIATYACNCGSENEWMCFTAECDPEMKHMTPDNCRARGPGWAPSNSVKCDNEEIGTKIEYNGCARCVCNQDNTPVQGDRCKPGDSCQMYDTCCETLEITSYACNCSSDKTLMCNDATCPPCVRK